MAVDQKLLFANVMHKRLFPKENSFSYRVYYFASDIEKLDELSDRRWFGLNKWGLASFHHKDHGPCDGSSLKEWADGLVAGFGGDLEIRKIVLVAMPRILGYGFNPVSFWLCLDAREQLRAVIAEVHNTFGERHVYFCRNDDGTVITRQNRIEADKLFHVSPFLPRNGSYAFKFDYTAGRFGVCIDYHDKDGRRQLVTSLSGQFAGYSRSRLLKAFVTCPLVTMKTIAMIHWQALRLVIKGIQYFPKPQQLAGRVVPSRRITNS